MEFMTKTSKGKDFKIIKQPDDPLCDRISLGGNPKHSMYLVYRGNLSNIEDLLSEALESIKKSREKLLIQSN